MAALERCFRTCELGKMHVDLEVSRFRTIIMDIM